MRVSKCSVRSFNGALFILGQYSPFSKIEIATRLENNKQYTKTT